MKLLIQDGALDGESVVNGSDALGEIKCTVSVFMLGRTDNRILVSSKGRTHTRRLALRIKAEAEKNQWVATGKFGELERWADKVLAQG